MATRYPRLRSDLIVRRQVLGGDVTYMVKDPVNRKYLRFNEAEWLILSQLNGENSFGELAERFRERYPDSPITAGQIEDFVDNLKKHEAIERTAAERSIAILEKLEAQRKKRAESSQVKDVFYLTIATVNPEKLLKAIYPYLRWIWTPYFVVATLAMFVAAGSVIISNWSVVRDGMLEFWNFENKTAGDVVMLLCIIFVILAIHEFAHALTCMNFGGEVNELGFMLIFFMPAFYAEVSDAYLFDKKWHKYWVTLAGGYSELINCSLAVFTWSLTEPGTLLNHLAFNVMVFAGISTIILNYNPLIKLDGYYLLSDILEIINLRASSASYLVYLIKKKVFRMDVAPPKWITPRRERIFLIYGILSTAYIILIVSFFILFLFRVFGTKFPEYGFFLGLLSAYLILRKRIKKFMAFSRFVYLDKREWLAKKASDRRWSLAFAVLVLLILLIPFPHSVDAPVVVEPERQQPLRAETEGFVAEVADNHGTPVPTGAVVVQLRNDALVAQRREAEAEVRRWGDEAAGALAQGDMASYQKGLREQQRAQKELAELQRQESKLAVRAPFDGRVLTPRLQDLLGKHVAPGESLCDFGDLRKMRARIRVSEFEFRELAEGQLVSLKVNSFPAETFQGRVEALGMAAPDTYDATGRATGLVRTAQAAAAIPAQLKKKKRLFGGEGIPFSHFDLVVRVENPEGRLRPGMSGLAKIYPDRHSLLARFFRFLAELVRSKVWW